MFTDKQLSQIIIRDEQTEEVLAVINRDGSILNGNRVSVAFNYGEPKRFVVEDDAC